MAATLDEVVGVDHALWMQYDWIEANLGDRFYDYIQVYCYK